MRKLLIAVDFDGTLCDCGYPNIEEATTSTEQAHLIHTLKMLQEDGHKLVLWTCRQGDFLEQAQEWAKNKYRLYFDYINDDTPYNKMIFGENNRKIFADIYIDDRSINWNIGQTIAKLYELGGLQ